MIQSFTCRNFRNVHIDELNFKRLNLIIGPNNAGKTNFIKALTFYSNLLKHADEGGLQTGFLNAVKRGGWEHIRNISAKENDPVSLSWRMMLGENRVDYDFGFMPGNKVEDSFIVQESMNSAEQRGYERPYNYFSCHREYAGQGYLSTAVSIGDANEGLPFSVSNTEVFCRQYKDIILSDDRLYNYRDRKKIGLLLNEMEESFLGIRSYASSRIDTATIRIPL
nr:AAA family ATPase [Lachnospiraceae bacterium]